LDNFKPFPDEKWGHLWCAYANSFACSKYYKEVKLDNIICISELQSTNNDTVAQQPKHNGPDILCLNKLNVLWFFWFFLIYLYFGNNI
jgi:hypothetical protein